MMTSKHGAQHQYCHTWALDKSVFKYSRIFKKKIGKILLDGYIMFFSGTERCIAYKISWCIFAVSYVLAQDPVVNIPQGRIAGVSIYLPINIFFSGLVASHTLRFIQFIKLGKVLV